MRIYDGLNNIGYFFYYIYFEVYDWPWLPELVPKFFYSISELFFTFAANFYTLWQWLEAATHLIPKFFDLREIFDFFSHFIQQMVDAFVWIYTVLGGLGSILAIWWSYTQVAVVSWIDAVRDYLQSQLNYLTGWLASLQVVWDEFKSRIPSLDIILSWFTNWWGNILVNLTMWWDERLLDIQSLIDSAFLLREGLWAGWQDIRDKVTEFFTDPEDWLYKAVDRIIERFW